MRQTNWGLKKLIEMFDSGNVRRCFLLNEIGTILKDGGDERKEAEAFLLKTLDSGLDASEKAVAVCYLSTVPNVASRTQEVLDKFRSDPANKEVLECVDIGMRRAGVMS
jgi:hypothetical protein